MNGKIRLVKEVGVFIACMMLAFAAWMVIGLMGFLASFLLAVNAPSLPPWLLVALAHVAVVYVPISLISCLVAFLPFNSKGAWPALAVYGLMLVYSFFQEELIRGFPIHDNLARCVVWTLPVVLIYVCGRLGERWKKKGCSSGSQAVTEPAEKPLAPRKGRSLTGLYVGLGVVAAVVATLSAIMLWTPPIPAEWQQVKRGMVRDEVIKLIGTPTAALRDLKGFDTYTRHYRLLTRPCSWQMLVWYNEHDVVVDVVLLFNSQLSGFFDKEIQR
jgi:hypothetical protein